MALTPSTSFTQDIDDAEAGVVADTTANYGTGGNPARGDAANYLLWSKTDKEGNRVFDNPNFGDVLTIMEWDVVTLVSGWYERMLMRIQPYAGGTSYVPQVESSEIVSQYASIVYYPTTNKVYKCILASIGNVPTDTTYWEEVTDLTEIIANTNVTTTISNTFVRGTVDEKMQSLYKTIGEKCACDSQENIRANNLFALLVAADSEATAGNYDNMEKIIDYLESQLLLAA